MKVLLLLVFLLFSCGGSDKECWEYSELTKADEACAKDYSNFLYQGEYIQFADGFECFCTLFARYSCDGLDYKSFCAEYGYICSGC